MASVQVNQRWPVELVDEVRAAAVASGVSMAAWTVAAVRERLEEGGSGAALSVEELGAAQRELNAVRETRREVVAAAPTRGVDVAAMERQARLNKPKGL